MLFKVIWPVSEAVDGLKILQWAEDAFANKQIEHMPFNQFEAARALNEAGLITLSKYQYF